MKDDALPNRFGIVLREMRQAANLSQEDFADKSGLHRTYIGNIERGEKTVTIKTANKIARALGLTLADLFVRVEHKSMASRPPSRKTRTTS